MGLEPTFSNNRIIHQIYKTNSWRNLILSSTSDIECFACANTWAISFADLWILSTRTLSKCLQYSRESRTKVWKYELPWNSTQASASYFAYVSIMHFLKPKSSPRIKHISNFMHLLPLDDTKFLFACFLISNNSPTLIQFTSSNLAASIFILIHPGDGQLDCLAPTLRTGLYLIPLCCALPQSFNKFIAAPCTPKTGMFTLSHTHLFIWFQISN